jgi:hypothetical protein
MIFTKYFFNVISDFGEEWVIKKIEADHLKKVAIIRLEYTYDKYFDPRTEDECTLYDHAPEREWRHLDL